MRNSDTAVADISFVNDISGCLPLLGF
jgi:hypothetical protein